jgi:hypothetical protein
MNPTEWVTNLDAQGSSMVGWVRCQLGRLPGRREQSLGGSERAESDVFIYW